jgi:hypothetical protein
MLKKELIDLFGIIEIYENACTRIEKYGEYPLNNAFAYYSACKEAREAYNTIIEKIKILCNNVENNYNRVVINSLIDNSLEYSLYLDINELKPIADYINLSKYMTIEW